jgi:hypothetical protein
MKKIFVSAGLVALGAAGLHADDTYAPDVTAMDATKIWSVSGTLRGFYDDNYTTSHSDSSGKRASWGFEFSPSLNLLVPLQQTELGLRYTYGLYYYQDRQNQGSNPIDQSHEADLWIDHSFTERWEGKVQDDFSVSQEPQLSSTPTAEPYRVEGNNIQNLGTVSIHTDWSMLFSTDLAYENHFVQYQNRGTSLLGLLDGTQQASLAGFLDQLDHSVFLNLNYQFEPDLTFLVGDQFELNRYTANEPIGIGPGGVFNSGNLDSYSEIAYVGGTYAATENLSATVEAGIQYTVNNDLPSFDGQSSDSLQPYAQVAVTYTYLPGSYVQAGFTQSETSSDTPDPGKTTSTLTTYQEASVLYASINHKITPLLLASIVGHYQYATYHGGANDGSSQNMYDLGFNLGYTINDHLSVEIGYNFDYVTAAAGLQSYARNREYIGITGTY